MFKSWGDYEKHWHQGKKKERGGVGGWWKEGSLVSLQLIIGWNHWEGGGASVPLFL